MKKSYTYISGVESGKLTKIVSSAIQGILKLYEGKVVEITIRERIRKRSSHQNAFWYGVMIPEIRSWFMEQGIVFDAEMTHEFCVRHVWKYTKVMPLPEGGTYEYRLSSSNLSAKEWEDYMDISRSYFAEKGLVLPFPNEHIGG